MSAGLGRIIADDEALDRVARREHRPGGSEVLDLLAALTVDVDAAVHRSLGDGDTRPLPVVRRRDRRAHRGAALSPVTPLRGARGRGAAACPSGSRGGGRWRVSAGGAVLIGALVLGSGGVAAAIAGTAPFAQLIGRDTGAVEGAEEAEEVVPSPEVLDVTVPEVTGTPEPAVTVATPRPSSPGWDADVPGWGRPLLGGHGTGDLWSGGRERAEELDRWWEQLADRTGIPFDGRSGPLDPHGHQGQQGHGVPGPGPWAGYPAPWPGGQGGSTGGQGWDRPGGYGGVPAPGDEGADEGSVPDEEAVGIQGVPSVTTPRPGAPGGTRPWNAPAPSTVSLVPREPALPIVTSSQEGASREPAPPRRNHDRDDAAGP